VLWWTPPQRKPYGTGTTWAARTPVSLVGALHADQQFPCCDSSDDCVIRPKRGLYI